MEKQIVMDQYPVHSKVFHKSDLELNSCEQIINYLMDKIEEDKLAAFIGIFNHYEHTKSRGGDINESIQEAFNLIFCFGAKIPNPLVVAIRPRSFGVVDLGDTIQVTFMQAPVEPMNNKMIQWVEEIN